MNREELLKRKKALEELVGPFDYDDPDYDGKRAFILFNAKDPNATWETIRTSAPTPEVAAKLDAAHKAAEEAAQDFLAWAEFHDTVLNE